MPGAVTERELRLLPTEGGSQAPRNFPWKGTSGSGWQHQELGVGWAQWEGTLVSSLPGAHQTSTPGEPRWPGGSSSLRTTRADSGSPGSSKRKIQGQGPLFTDGYHYFHLFFFLVPFSKSLIPAFLESWQTYVWRLWDLGAPKDGVTWEVSVTSRENLFSVFKNHHKYPTMRYFCLPLFFLNCMCMLIVCVHVCACVCVCVCVPQRMPGSTARVCFDQEQIKYYSYACHFLVIQ